MITALARYSIVALFGLSSGSIVLALWGITTIARPGFGFRGVQRSLAMRRSPLFRVTEPAIRVVATWWGLLARTPRIGPWLEILRARQVLQLEHAGHFLGLTPDEYTGLSLLSMIGGAGSTGAIAVWLDQPHWVVGVGAGLGLALPYLRVKSTIRARRQKIRRDLPTAIDLAAMCVNAGLDFPGALRAIAQGADEKDLVAQEFAQLLASLHLGHTRRYALLEFERRVPIDQVRNFVRELIQAEEKGNPIAEALTLQAEVSRTQRSIAAEEAAARAGVLMIVPMMLLLGCILLMLMGPFIVNGMGL